MKKINELYSYFLESNGVATDTRQEIKDKIYFALSGDNFDGNQFAENALKKGALLCVIDNPDFKRGDKCFLVDDVLKTLQELARHHRVESDVTVLAITGSNGKTTTKELVSSVLRSSMPIVSTKGNLNNHIGVPLTLLQITENTEIAVVEMGANHMGEIGFLCEIAQPDVGIITNIGKAHLEGFGSFAGVIAAKSELYSYIDKANGELIVNIDDDLLTELSGDISKVTYGTNDATIEGEIVVTHPFLQVKWGNNQDIFHCHSKLYGNYNFYNILAAISVGVFFDVDKSIVNEAIENYIPENNRSQQLRTKKNRIILDAYNANPFSLNAAIQSFSQSNFKCPWLLIGDMFELGEYSQIEHQVVVDQMTSLGFSNVILVGDEFLLTKNHTYLSFSSTKEALLYIKNNRIENADILIKGSRGMRMEDLLEVL